MSLEDELPTPPRYRLLRFGVRDLVDGAEFTAADTVRWQAYQDWIRAGNAPLPELAPVTPPDRTYYTDAGLARRERQRAKLSDEDFIAQLRKETP